MRTRLIKVSPSGKPNSAITEAARFIKAGEVVAFPTETVYGLGADAMNAKAVKKIFEAKGRPADNPLIVHISGLNQLDSVVSEINDSAQNLIDSFWPGPLSIVMKKNQKVPNITTAELDTVVIRFPSHPIAQALISAAGTPIAAPSANLSGKVSPTKAKHVVSDLNKKIPIVIDGGPIKYGLESTVVDCTGEHPVILRPGSITYEMIKTVVPDIENLSKKSELRSPGMKYRHYATETPITLFTGQPKATGIKIKKYLAGQDVNKLIVLWHDGDFSKLPNHFKLPANAYEAAPILFDTMRGVDMAAEQIIIQKNKYS